MSIEEKGEKKVMEKLFIGVLGTIISAALLGIFAILFAINTSMATVTQKVENLAENSKNYVTYSEVNLRTTMRDKEVNALADRVKSLEEKVH